MSGPRFSAGPSRIEGRAAEGWVVGGLLYSPALLLSGSVAYSLPALSFDALATADLPLLDDVELLLLGTGEIFRRPPPEFVSVMQKRGWRVEPMDSRAAARTFNVLAAEERLVGALIF